MGKISGFTLSDRNFFFLPHSPSPTLCSPLDTALDVQRSPTRVAFPHKRPPTGSNKELFPPSRFLFIFHTFTASPRFFYPFPPSFAAIQFDWSPRRRKTVFSGSIRRTISNIINSDRVGGSFRLYMQSNAICDEWFSLRCLFPHCSVEFVRCRCLLNWTKHSTPYFYANQ